METSSMRSRRHRNPQQKTDVQNESSEHAAPFFSNGQVQTKKEPAFFQPKLTIGKADDPYEREADAVADKVVNKTNGQPPSVQNKEISSIQRLATPDEDKMPATNDGRMAEDKKIQEKPMVQKSPTPKEEEKPAVQKMEAPKEEEKPAVQKMEAPKKEEEKPAVQKMEAPKKEEEKPAVQKMEAPKEEEKPAVQKMEAPKKEEEKPAVQKMEAPEDEEKSVQAKAESGGGVASQAVASKIDSTKGRGEQMPEKTKTKMESAFGRDFSDVHIHNDTSSVEMNRELNAQAFTHGKDIYFNSGKFNPQNTEGAHLLAHELTHVVQQNNETIQKKDKTPKQIAVEAEHARVKKLKEDYAEAVIEARKTSDWSNSAELLNGFSKADILVRLKQLTTEEKKLITWAAERNPRVGPASQGAMVSKIAWLDGEIADAEKTSNWSKAAEFMNAFNREDMLTRLSQKNEQRLKDYKKGAEDNIAVGDKSQVALVCGEVLRAMTKLGTKDVSSTVNKIETIDKVKQYDTFITEASTKYGVSVEQIRAIIATESKGNPTASSGAAFGLMQLTKGTWEGTKASDSSLSTYDFDSNWKDPHINILFGVAALKNKMASVGVAATSPQFSTLAIVAYNAGEGTVRKAMKNAKDAGSTNAEVDCLKAEYLKPAIKSTGIHSYYFTGGGWKRNEHLSDKGTLKPEHTEEQAIARAVDLKFAEVSGYPTTVANYQNVQTP